MLKIDVPNYPECFWLTWRSEQFADSSYAPVHPTPLSLSASLSSSSPVSSFSFAPLFINTLLEPLGPCVGWAGRGGGRERKTRKRLYGHRQNSISTILSSTFLRFGIDKMLNDYVFIEQQINIICHNMRHIIALFFIFIFLVQFVSRPPAVTLLDK